MRELKKTYIRRKRVKCIKNVYYYSHVMKISIPDQFVIILLKNYWHLTRAMTWQFPPGMSMLCWLTVEINNNKLKTIF